MTSRVGLVFGTMVFGARVTDQNEIDDMVRAMVAQHSALVDATSPAVLDTALIYPMVPNSEGLTERILAETVARLGLGARVLLHTKINPWCADRFTAAGVQAQTDRILKNLNGTPIDLFYLHAPDHAAPIDETLAAVDALYRKGAFKRFGLSNYSAWQVAEIVGICRLKGYVVPTVYQALYNAISRDIERELVPCLIRHGIALYVYNATAGGLLTAKHSIDQVPTDNSRFSSPIYRQRYWRETFFEAVSAVKAAAELEGIPMADIAHRWLANHSKLSGARGDAIIIGASSTAQVVQNSAASVAGPLPASILAALDAANEIAKPQWPSYFR